MKRVERFSVFSSGSAALDELLGGGFREGSLVHLYGRSGTGKTQIAMQSALIASRRGQKVLFVDTEGSFRPERVREIAQERKVWEEGILDRIVYARIDSMAEQRELVRRMQKNSATTDCRMVVVDTLTRNFSLELPGHQNMQGRQAALSEYLSEMARDAFLNGRAYVLTNRVVSVPGKGEVSVGGNTVSDLVKLTVHLVRVPAGILATESQSLSTRTLRLGGSAVE